MLAIT